MPPYWFQNLGGGRDGGLHPASIRDNQLADILNFYIIGSKLKRRGGCSLVNEWAWPNSVAHSGITCLSAGSSAGVYLPPGTYLGMMVAGAPRLWAIGTGWIAAPIPTTLPAAAAGTLFRPWFFERYRDVLYTVHPGYGRMGRVTGTTALGIHTASHDQAGIPAPALQCAAVDGGAGAITAGTYYITYTHYNTLTGAESNPAPASAPLVVGAGRQLAWSNIAVSPTAQVNARRLYRTFANQQGEYYFVGQINDNVTTTYADNVAALALGRAVRFDNGDIHTLATAFIGMAVWGSRMWLTDGTKVYHSNLGLPECFDTEQGFFDVFPNDGEPILGLYAYGDRLVVMKQSKLYYITGTGPGSFGVYVLSEHHGCPAPHSMKSVGTRLFWFDGTNFCTTEGGAVRVIGETAIRDRLATVSAPANGVAFCVQGVIVPERHQYHAVVPTSALSWYTDGATNCLVPKFSSEVLVYDYVTDSWTRYQYPAIGNPSFLLPTYDFGSYILSGYLGIFNANTTSRLENYDRPSLLQDNGSDISASLITKAVGGGITGVLRRVHLMLPPYAGRTITLDAYDDGNAGYTSAVKTRAALSIADRDAVKSFNLSTAGRLSRLLQMKLTYAGTDAIELSGIGLEVDEHQRLVRQPR
jgi:hypothetical protein